MKKGKVLFLDGSVPLFYDDCIVDRIHFQSWMTLIESRVDF